MENKKVRRILHALSEGIETIHELLESGEVDELSILTAALELLRKGDADKALALASLVAKRELYEDLTSRFDIRALLLLPHIELNHYNEFKKWLNIVPDSDLPWLVLPFLKLSPAQVIDIITRHGTEYYKPNIAVAIAVSAYRLSSNHLLDSFFTDFFRAHLTDGIIHTLISRLRFTKLEVEAKAILWLLQKVPDKLPPKVTISATVTAVLRHPTLMLLAGELIGSLADSLPYEDLKNLAFALSKSRFDQLRELAVRIASTLKTEDAIKVLSRLALDQKMKVRRTASEGLLLLLDRGLSENLRKRIAMLLIRTGVSRAIITGLNILSQEELSNEEALVVLKAVKHEKRSSVIRAALRFLESHSGLIGLHEMADALSRYLRFATLAKKVNLVDEILCFVEGQEKALELAKILLKKQELPKQVKKRLERILKRG